MNSKKAVYSRAQAAILQSSRVSMRETAKIPQKKKARAGQRNGQVHKSQFYKPRCGLASP